MGQMVTKLMLPLQSYGDSMLNKWRPTRKRKSSCLDSNEADEENGQTDQSPKRRKLLSTTQYIYNALFKEKKNSDVAIMALDKVWNLHKVYLSQSPYFHSMFNGSWIESCKDFVHIKIIDERITPEALDAVFGSLYSDEIDIDETNVVSILAAATLFHLDSIIDKCIEVMIETINMKTVISYYEAGNQYGIQFVKQATFIWLETNLLCIYNKCLTLLQNISIDLMTDLVSSPHLYTMQTEFSIYALLRCWMYLRLHPNCDPLNPMNPLPQHGDQQQQQKQQEKEQQQQQQQQQQQEQQQQLQQKIQMNTQQQQQEQQDQDAISQNSNYVESPSQSSYNSSVGSNTFPSGIHMETFFKSREDEICFLATREGGQFLKPFIALRTQYLTNHYMDLNIILTDNIIPREWIYNHVLSHWLSILKIDHIQGEGPQRLDEEVFDEHCMRCGRILLEPGYQKWRWTGFHFGLDLIFIADSRMLSIRRHHRSEHERLLSLQNKIQFMIRVWITSINEQRQPIYTQRSEILSLSLERNEESILMVMDNNLVYPLLVSVNLMITSPTSQVFKKNQLTYDLCNTNNTNAQVPISEIGTKCEQQPSIRLPSALSSPRMLPLLSLAPGQSDRTVSSTSLISNTPTSGSLSSNESDSSP